MEFAVLGPLRVVDDAGHQVVVGSRTERVVLASLLVRAGEVVPLATLAAAVWGDDPPASAVHAVRAQIALLQRTLGERITATADGYLLEVHAETDTTDSWRFDRALRRMREDPGPTSYALLAAELASWRGAAYGELADVETISAEAERLELARVAATELVATADLRAGRCSEAADAAESIVADDPLREASWEILVRALGGAGRVADAMRAARRAAAALAGAGRVSGPGLRAAEAEVLEGKPSSSDTAPARPSSRPRAPLTPTIGRSTELARALLALDDARLVTIVGPGGVGKTRLAVDVAGARAGAHARGALVVELARVADAAGVASTIAATLDLRPPPGGELAALSDLGSLDALVVLDNCEHVIDAVVSVASPMLAAGDRLRLLATSREPLAIAGEHVLPLHPLATDGADAPAIEMFRQRAVAAAPTGALDPDLIADVVSRLDGLPLALEMAAARLRTMTLSEVASSIGDDLDILASPRRDVEERHRTLRDLLAWSERLLDDELRDALHDFSVFAGPVRARDLPAVIRTNRPADTIARLVDRSLVLAAPTPAGVRFSALETVRSFGRDRLRAAGRHNAARRRHAEWFVARIGEIDAQMRTVNEPAAIIRFGDIFDELRAAMRWSLDEDLDLAVELAYRAYVPGRIVLRAEVVSWASDVEERLPADHPATWRVRGALAGGLSMAGRLDDAVRIALDVLEHAPDSHESLYALEALADAALYEGRLDDAAARAGMAVELSSRLGDDFFADFGRVGVAMATAYGGDPDGALAIVADGPVCPAPTLAAWFEYVRGEAILDGDAKTALAHLERAVEIASAAGDRYVTEVALLSSSSLRARTGELPGAVERFSALLEHFRGGGDPGHLVTSLRNLVTLLVRLHQYRPATALYAAVVDHPSSPTYGAEAERLHAAADECLDALGDDEFERVAAVGRSRTLDATVDAAAAALRASRHPNGPHGRYGARP